MSTTNSMSIEEKLILSRAQKGEREAFAEIYDFYVVKIFRFIYLKTGSRENAEDLTADVFLKSWEYIKGRNKEINKIESFLYKIARNVIIDFYKKKSNSELDINEEAESRIPDKKQDIFGNLNRKQEIEELIKALEKIKSEYREVIILRHVEEMSIAEIAEIMESTEGSIRVKIHRAVKALRKAINEGGCR